jgi:DNA-binding transcriptional MerR regulator
MEQLADVAQLAETFGLPPETLRYWRHIGRGPRAYKIGRHIRYRPSEVEEWLRAQAVGSERPGAA